MTNVAWTATKIYLIRNLKLKIKVLRKPERITPIDNQISICNVIVRYMDHKYASQSYRRRRRKKNGSMCAMSGRMFV